MDRRPAERRSGEPPRADRPPVVGPRLAQPLLLLLAISLAAVTVDLAWTIGTHRVFPNVTAAGVEAGGLTITELTSALEGRFAEVGAAPDGSLPNLRLVFLDNSSGRSWSFDAPGLGLALSAEKTAVTALGFGRPVGPSRLPARLRQALVAFLACSVRGKALPASVTADGASLAAAFAAMGSEINATPGNNSVDPETGDPHPGHAGRLLNLADSEKVLFDSLASAVEQARGASPRVLAASLVVPLVIDTLPPRGNLGRLNALDLDHLGTYVTTFDASEKGRAWNIMLAASRLDGTIIEPGGVISFNQVVGDRTPEAGFKEAPELVGTELVPGCGGGVCQVAGTVFNAALLSDLTIVERTQHSRVVSYLAPGRDATVAFPSIDLVVSNPGPSPVVLAVSVEEGRVRASFWGPAAPGRSVKVFTEERAVYPAPDLAELSLALAPGARVRVKEPLDGRDVALWREVSAMGRVIRREMIALDHYEPVSGLVRVGRPDASAGAGPAVGDGPGPSAGPAAEAAHPGLESPPASGRNRGGR